MLKEKFGPINQGCMRLPEHVGVLFIGEERDVPVMLKVLLNSEFIGLRLDVDSHDYNPGLIQLASDKAVFLIDIVKLKLSPTLDQVLT